VFIGWEPLPSAALTAGFVPLNTHPYGKKR
jgi:hypothetical protein